MIENTYTNTSGTAINDLVYRDTQTTTVPPSYNNCPYRLPCGHCIKLGYQCPYGNKYYTTWKITC